MSDVALGKLKLEYIFEEAIFLAPKVYAGRLADGSEVESDYSPYPFPILSYYYKVNSDQCKDQYIVKLSCGHRVEEKGNKKR